MRRISLTLLAAAAILTAAGQGKSPMATDYTLEQCEGSLTPYPAHVDRITVPDSLTAVYISHVGRHGSRYPASATHTRKLRAALQRADSLGTVTPLGRDLLKLCRSIETASKNRWGALDSLGMAEQRAIATRMYNNFKPVFANATVSALSSYSPRAMMSMYSFTHQLDRMDNSLEFVTTTGRVNSPLMRPFDVDEDYLQFRRDDVWAPAYNEYFESVCPLTAIGRVLGRDYPYGDTETARDLAITEYYVLAGLQAMEMPSQMAKYFNTAEANALWSCFNLRQYLQRTATTVSTVPADIASQLVLNIINKADQALTGQGATAVDLRFGHAETVMPLVSLLRLPGCYYLTNYFDTVAGHWRDFDVVPMAANVQFVFYKTDKGNIYMQTLLNERPVTLIPNDPRLYVPWGEARAYMMRCIPMHLQ